MSAWLDSLKESLNEQEWFKQIKDKWDELDAQSQLYLKFAIAGIAAFALIFGLGSFWWSVHKLKSEAAEKSDLLTLIQSSSDELKRLQSSNASLSATPNPEPWPTYIDGVASRIGLDKSAVTVSDPKAGTSNDHFKESLMDISLKKINLRQLVKFAQGIENGQRPVKLRNLVVDTQPDGTGYMDATLSISAFNLVVKQ